MRKNVFRAKGLALLLTAALLVPQMSGVSADAKAKKPKLLNSQRNPKREQQLKA